MVDVVAVPLTREAFAPFGFLVAAGPGEGKPANRGTARRHDRQGELQNLRSSATPNVCLFRCQPVPVFPHEVHLLEKHPGSTQLFVPMQARRYLVVVAEGGDAPDLSTVRAFLADGRQGIAYAPGTWHHPLLALDVETDFACVVHEDGGAGDCVDVPVHGVRVVLP